MSISAPSPEQVSDYIGLDQHDDYARLQDVYETACALVEDALRTAHRDVPESVVRQIVCDTAQNLWNRRNSTNGAQFLPADGGFPERTANDPLRKSRPLISRYVVDL